MWRARTLTTDRRNFERSNRLSLRQPLTQPSSRLAATRPCQTQWHTSYAATSTALTNTTWMQSDGML